MNNEDMMKITSLDPEHLKQLVAQTMKINKIDPNLYVEYDVFLPDSPRYQMFAEPKA